MMPGYASQAKAEQMWRIRLFFTLEDMEIDPTSPVGLDVIDHYRPTIRCSEDYRKFDDADEITKWIEAQYMGGE